MNGYNEKMLKFICGGYAVVAVLSTVIMFVLNKLGCHSAYVYTHYVFELVILGLLIWAGVSGRKAGFNVLGIIGAWSSAFFLLLVLGVNIFNVYLGYSYDYSDVSTAIQIFGYVSTTLSIMDATCFTLFAIGNKLNMITRISLIATVWILGISYLLAAYAFPYMFQPICRVVYNGGHIVACNSDSCILPACAQVIGSRLHLRF